MRKRIPGRRRPSLFLLLAAALACEAAPGFAQTTSGQVTEAEREEARAHFVAGSQSFSRGNFRQAIVQFGKAFDLVRSPEILFNIGRCHEELGETEEAIYHYEMYLRFFPDAEDSEAVRARIASLRGEGTGTGTAPEKSAEERPGQARVEGGKSGPEKGAGIWLGLGLGVGGGVSGPSEGVVVPIEITAGFPLVRWLEATAAFRYGHYFPDTSDRRRSGTSAYYSQNQVGGIVGLRGVWPVAEIAAMTAGLGFSALWIDFGHEKGKTCLAGRANGGVALDISDNWQMFFDLWISAGALLGKKIANTPLADDTPETEIGFAVAVAYRF